VSKTQSRGVVEFRLTVLSLAVAVAVLTAILGVEKGFEDRVERAATAVPGNRFVATRVLNADQEHLFDPTDFEHLSRKVTRGQAIAMRAGVRQTVAKIVTYQGKPPVVTNYPLELLPVSHSYFAVAGLKIREGRLFDAEESERGARVAVIGSGLAEDLQLKVGLPIRQPPYLIGEFVVIGILAETGQNWPRPCPSPVEFMNGLDYTIFVPLSSDPRTMRAAWAPGPEILVPTEPSPGVEFLVEAGSGDIGAAAAEVESILRARGYDDVKIQPMSGLRALYTRVSKNISKLLLYVALLALALAGVNLTNLILVTLIRQSRLIGIKRSLGADRTRIHLETAVNAVKIAFTGGAIGVAAGVWVCRPLGELVGQSLRISLDSVLSTFALLAVLALAASLYPATLASAAAPVTMIRDGLAATHKRRRIDVRNMLAGLGVFVGVAAVVLIIALGDGTRLEISRLMRSAGQGLLIIRQPDAFKLQGRPAAMVSPDLVDMARALPGVTEVVWQESAQVSIRAGQQRLSAHVVSADPNVYSLRSFMLATGSVPGTPDGAVLGAKLAKTLFPSGSPVGATIRVGDVPFSVAGVLAPRPGYVIDLGGDRDFAVIIPRTPASKEIFAAVTVEREVWLRASEGSLASVRASLEESLRARSGPFAPPDVVVPAGELTDLKTLQSDLTRVLAVLAAIALFVGGLGITSYMFVRVAEESRQIGITRAIGATRGRVGRAYLVRALRTCLLAGGLGLAAAVVIMEIVCLVKKWPFLVSWKWMALAFLVSAGAGTVFGFLPALRAAGLSPMEAIRQE
jgi:putative ABC transport system permease protein